MKMQAGHDGPDQYGRLWLEGSPEDLLEGDIVLDGQYAVLDTKAAKHNGEDAIQLTLCDPGEYAFEVPRDGIPPEKGRVTLVRGTAVRFIRETDDLDFGKLRHKTTISPNLSSLEVPRYINDQNPLIAAQQQHQFQQIGPLVVQQVLPPVPHHKFRDQDGDLPVLQLFFFFQNEIHHRRKHKPVGRMEVHQLRDLHSGGTQRRGNPVLPVLADALALRPIAVLGFNMHRNDVRRHAQRET